MNEQHGIALSRWGSKLKNQREALSESQRRVLTSLLPYCLIERVCTLETGSISDLYAYLNVEACG